ncbi:hypothetical protein FPZ24_11885 [Sphingomonas panacisoli]|uniref:OmpR/PhoB-type domain-containing protein n=1 Tax=Sphingomonas panacisoli TaxID=1813879 RepID=A0A5B8LKJ2_9SPHN|nr:winged helix-turn-helix domain-containing protein [Sphingomonas panacisoli]QDZ08094.1 hypothetical protein FPZ24_11885 [Sphingomonas panacisoli]
MTDISIIELARIADFRLGPLMVKPSLRQMMLESGEEEIVEPRVMQVLVALARAEGAIVSRSDLSASCWENRIVGDDAINRVLSRLRRIQDGVGRGAFRIETITKIGYRLLRPDEVNTIKTLSAPIAAEVVTALPINSSTTPKRQRPLWAWIAAAALIVATSVGIALLAIRITATSRPTRIAVLPFDVISNDPTAQGFAKALNEQIVTGLNSSEIPAVSSSDAAALRGPGAADRIEALGVALTFDGSVRNDGKTISIQVHVNDPVQHVSIWSRSDQGDVASLDALRTRVTRTVVSVLACSNRALKKNGLTDAALLGRYLRVCDLFVNEGDAANPGATFELLDDLRVLTRNAPGFVAAHSDLAKFEAYLAPLFPSDQAAMMRKESGAEAARALELEPNSPDAYLAQEMALPPTQWAKREELLRRGIAIDPDWPHTNGFLAQLLLETGRLRESTTYSAHAAAADLQIDWRPAAAWMMCSAGSTGDTIDDLRGRLAAAPGDTRLQWSLRECLVDSGRFEEAKAVFATPLPPKPYVTASSLMDRLIAAMISKSAGDRDAARRDALALAAQPGPYRMGDAIQALALLGFLDDAFDVASNYRPGYPMTGHTVFLFDGRTAAMRRDPRFMPLMVKLGLAGFWRTSGKWPDYCSDPGLPYNCKAEVARLVGKN